MAEREEAGQPQRYCRDCGAQVRAGNAFCSSCGNRLGPAAAMPNEAITAPHVRGAPPRYGGLLNRVDARVALYGVGALLFLIVAYLILSYSVALAIFLISLVGVAVLVVRKARVMQTKLEQQAFERASLYRESAQRAYEEGKHRELAQKAYQQSKSAYEEANAQYRRWSENQAPGAGRERTRPTGIRTRARNAWAVMPKRWRLLFVAIVVIVPLTIFITFGNALGPQGEQKKVTTNSKEKESASEKVQAPAGQDKYAEREERLLADAVEGMDSREREAFDSCYADLVAQRIGPPTPTPAIQGCVNGASVTATNEEVLQKVQREQDERDAAQRRRVVDAE